MKDSPVYLTNLNNPTRIKTLSRTLSWAPTLSKKLTRYRLTLDVMIDNSASEPPSRWEWEKLLQLEGNEQVNDVYVENLGDYKV